jgi:2-amino-4-hydroxy-6-hydroxymethyldihydropteridine diphosphokinase
MPAVTVYLALGSNLGDRRANLLAAVGRLPPLLTVLTISSTYETAPAYVTDQPDFLNLVLSGWVDSEYGSPRALLRYLKAIEFDMGRQAGQRYGPRLIDLDILLYGDEFIAEPDLVVPHPHLTERAFVLVPLAEIAPELIVPGQSETVSALARRPNTVGRVLRVG